MKDKFFYLIVLIVLICTASLHAQVSKWIRLSTQTGHSAYIADNYLYTPWPNHPDIVGISWTVNLGIPASGRTLFKFNLDEIPQSAQILDARLSLFGNPTPSNPGHDGDNRSFLRRVVSSWNPEDVVWKSQPDFTHQDEVLLQAVPYNQDVQNINVTSLVQEMVKNPESNFGFFIMQRSEYPYRSMNFASGTCFDSSKRPLLKIIYKPTGINLINGIVPVSYMLYQNFPNPFNPSTKIIFDLPNSSFVSVNIYNSYGQLVQTLFSQNLSTGKYSLDWNAGELPSGVYFCRTEFISNELRGERFSDSRKMLLVK